MACADAKCENLSIIASLKEEIASLQRDNAELRQSLSAVDQNSLGRPSKAFIHSSGKNMFCEQSLSASQALLRGEDFLPDVLKRDNYTGKGTVAPVGEDFSTPQYSTSEEVTVISGSHCNLLCCAFMYEVCAQTLKLSGGADSRLCVYNVEGEVLTSHTFDAPLISICIIPQSKGMVIGTMSGSVYFASLKETGSSNVEIEVHKDAKIKKHTLNVTCIKVSQSRKWLAVASRDRTVHIYKYHEITSTVEHSRSLNCADCPESIEFVENIFGSTCLVVSILGNNYLQYVAVENTVFETPAGSDGKDILQVGKVELINMNMNGDNFVSFNVLDIATAPMGLPLLAVATDKSRHIIFQSGTSTQVRNLYGHRVDEYGRPKIAWHPTGKYLISTSDAPCCICIWSVCSGQMLTKLHGHTMSIRSVVVNRRSNEIMSCSFDKTIRVWNDKDEN